MEHKVPVVGYPISADERNAKIDAAIKLNAEYEAVRQRIAKNAAEKAAEA